MPKHAEKPVDESLEKAAETSQEPQEVSEEVLEYFEERNKLPSGYHKGDMIHGDVAKDASGKRVRVAKPENPEDRF